MVKAEAPELQHVVVMDDAAVFGTQTLSSVREVGRRALALDTHEKTAGDRIEIDAHPPPPRMRHDRHRKRHRIRKHTHIRRTPSLVQVIL